MPRKHTKERVYSIRVDDTAGAATRFKSGGWGLKDIYYGMHATSIF